MSKLQKAAWVNLIGVSVGVVVMAACVSILAARNAKGIDYLVISFTLGQNAAFIILVYFFDFLFGFVDNLLLLSRYFQVHQPKAQACKGGMVES